jgi:DNA-directed RNA polymerase subunit M/transcription elongation factor TFIIS
MADPTTSPKVTVFIVVQAKCPKCSARIERQSSLTYDSLVTGNTTERASYHADAMIDEVDNERTRRGWLERMCGKCRDVEPANSEEPKP